MHIISECDKAGGADVGDVANMIAAIPGANWAWDRLLEWWHLPLAEWLKRTVEVVLQVAGLFEFVRLIDNRVFKRRATLEKEREVLESRVKEQNDIISGLRATQKQLNGDLAAARGDLPEAAIARARRELDDMNHEKAIRHLEAWFSGNGASIAAIAKELAQHHIVQAASDPGEHLRHARDMLRVARGVSPSDKELRELSNELDVVNAGLEEQRFNDGDSQLAWNSAMFGGPGAQGDALVPQIIALRDMARWFFNRGLWRLTPLFAERSAELARRAGKPHRRLWCGQETLAAIYQDFLGRSAEALPRIDRVLKQAKEFAAISDPLILDARSVRARALRHLGRHGEALAEIDAFAPIEADALGERHPDTLTTRCLRAQALGNLGRYGEALAEIDAFAPIQADALGERHPDTLATRYLRAQALGNLGRYGEALAEIDPFAPIEADALGERHPDTLATRYLRAQTLGNLGRHGEALAEIDAFAPIQADALGERHPDTLATRYLRAQALGNLGRYGEALAEIDAFAPIEADALGERHPNTLATRCLRAQALGNLGRHGEALAEIDAFAPIQADALGERHPDTLATRYLRAQALGNLGRHGEALAEIDAFAPIQADALGERHPNTLATRYLRAQTLGNLGRHGEALAEIDAFAPIEADALGERHHNTLATRSLRIGVEIAGRTHVDRTTELREIISDLAREEGASSRAILFTRYRLARLLEQQTRSDLARIEVTRVVSNFDRATSPEHVLLQSANILLEMIEGRPTGGVLVV